MCGIQFTSKDELLKMFKAELPTGAVCVDTEGIIGNPGERYTLLTTAAKKHTISSDQSNCA